MSELAAEFWITICAIIVGPVIAVMLTRYFDRRKNKRDRKLYVFRSLMRTRRTRGDPEHIGALNLAEVDFTDSKRVIAAHKSLVDFFGDQSWWPKTDLSDELLAKRSLKHDELLTKLLSEMARNLGYQIEQIDILMGGYSPEIYAVIESQQNKARELLAGLSDGTKAVPIAVLDYRSPEQIQAAAQQTEEITGQPKDLNK